MPVKAFFLLLMISGASLGVLKGANDAWAVLPAPPGAHVPIC